MRLIEKFLSKFEPEAKKYAEQVFNYERYGLEKEDIVQEMRIKIYMAIVGFSRQWKEYRTTGKRKPAPIEYWVKTALVNKKKDFIKKFNYEQVANVDKVSIGSGEDTIDVGEHKTSSFILDSANGIGMLNGIDLVENLVGDRRTIYIKFMEGFSAQELTKEFPSIGVESLINRHNRYLANKVGQELLEFRNEMITTSVQTED